MQGFTVMITCVLSLRILHPQPQNQSHFNSGFWWAVVSCPDAASHHITVTKSPKPLCSTVSQFVLVLKLTQSVSDADVLPLALQQFRLQVEVVCQGHPWSTRKQAILTSKNWMHISCAALTNTDSTQKYTLIHFWEMDEGAGLSDHLIIYEAG